MDVLKNVIVLLIKPFFYVVVDVVVVALKLMLRRTPDTGRFATTIFSALQRCNIVATLFRMVTTLLQRCNAVLSSLL